MSTPVIIKEKIVLEYPSGRIVVRETKNGFTQWVFLSSIFRQQFGMFFGGEAKKFKITIEEI